MIDEELNRILRNLAACAEDQEAYLRSIGVWPSIDELGLEYDDLALPIDGKPIDENLGSLLLALNRKLSSLPRELWCPDALYASGKWSEIRGLAKRILGTLDSV